MAYQIGICDDEKSACSELEGIILNFFKASDIQAEVNVWNSAEDLIRDVPTKVDLDILFLNIELPDKNGIDVGQYIRNEINNKLMHILYLSSNATCAIDIFKVHPYDFLIKPVNHNIVINDIINLLDLDEYDKRYFTYQFNRCKFRIHMKDIIYFESDRKHIRIVGANGMTGEFVGKIKELADELPFGFSMVAKSYIINLQHIKEYKKNFVTLDNGLTINVGRKYKDSFNVKIIEYNECRGKGWRAVDICFGTFFVK